MNSSPETTTPAGLDPNPPGHPAASPPPLLSPFAGGTSSGGTRALPTKAARGRRLWPWVLLTLGVAASTLGTLRVLHARGVVPAQYDVTNYVFPVQDKDRPDILTHKVKRERLDVKVTEKGTLESADNRDVICKVRAGA